MKKVIAEVLIVLAVFALFWFLIFKLPYFDIEKIEVSGLDNLSEEQVKGMLTTSEGENIFSFSTSKCENEIRKSHYIKEVSVSRSLPNKVIVNVEEYKLRGYVPYMGSYLFINEDGLVLDTQKDITKQLPVVEGLHFDSFTVGEILKVDNSQAFTTMVELAKLFEKYNLLTEVVRVDVTNSQDVHLYINKVDVELGNLDDANRKLLMLVEVLKQLDTNYAGKLNLTGDNATFEYLT
ncbi:MAG: cell division protein FtsQ/DivIB [Lachnospirales bacterium]